MENMPIRQIREIPKEPNLSGSYSVIDIQDLLLEKDMVQELHRHDFYYILVLKKGSGSQEIYYERFGVKFPLPT